MASYPLRFSIAQAIGLTGSAWLSGNIFALSMNAAPALQASRLEDNAPPDLIVKQWRNLYRTGKRQNPPIALISTSAFLYLAYSSANGSRLFRPAPYNRSGLYCAAAALTLAIIPFTLLTMKKTNNALLDLAEPRSPLLDDTARESAQLIDKWIFLNSIRGIFPLAGSLIGITVLLI